MTIGLHTVKLAVRSANHCCTATTMAYTSSTGNQKIFLMPSHKSMEQLAVIVQVQVKKLISHVKSLV